MGQNDDVVIFEKKRKAVDVIDLTGDDNNEIDAESKSTRKKKVARKYSYDNEINSDEEDEEDGSDQEKCLKCGYYDSEFKYKCECGACCCEDCFVKIDDNCGFCVECSDEFTCNDCCDGGYCRVGGYHMCSSCTYNHPERCGCRPYDSEINSDEDEDEEDKDDEDDDEEDEDDDEEDEEEEDESDKE
eukprot:CAMPEP_0182430254 /NCGR_PEP_ID=MMETSP1167-20130531/38876_1 /TAXON_ID=2988 /ORGANISM="Mallomonas Sp, Strain CCMP3275" /LENGTH=186 /DNA_ID=CAMNT_0024615159 /DNA_START=94 /DNA_END=654 /DNA_ORIENTATION=-